jgi:hypothetical protein
MIVVVVVDICVMPKDFLDPIKSEIQRQLNILPQNVLISSTHTHAAGSVASVYLGSADVQYMKKLPELILRAVQLAKQKIKAAKIGWGAIDVPAHVLCRRYIMQDNYFAANPVNGRADLVKTNPFGGESQILNGIAQADPQVAFLAVKGLDDEWISVLANYSLHYVGDWPNGTISSDYFGEFSRRIHEKLNAGDDFVAMMSNGTSGDINIWDFMNPDRYPAENFKKSELIGEDIAIQVFQEIKQLEWDTDPKLGVQYADVSLKLRKPSSDELEEAKKIIGESTYEGMEVNSGNLRKLYAREQVLLDDLPDFLLFPLQAIKIGKGIIGGMGGEIFAETGLWLKKNAPVSHYFTISLANGNAGYVPPEHEHKSGGYETWRSRTSKSELKAEEKIKNALMGLIQALDISKDIPSVGQA